MGYAGASVQAQGHTTGNPTAARKLAVALASHHAPNVGGLERIGRIRRATEELLAVLLESAPPCPERSTAVAKAREAMMWGNCAVIFAAEGGATP